MKESYLNAADNLNLKCRFWIGKWISKDKSVTYLWGKMGHNPPAIRLLKTNLTAREIVEIFWGEWRRQGWTPEDVKKAFARGQYGF